MSCPNPNIPEYKELLKQLGSDEAVIYTWKVHQESFPPSFKPLKELGKELSLPSAVANVLGKGVSFPFSKEEKDSLVNRLKDYNKKNNTSHHLIVTPDDGEYLIDFKVNYNPLNIAIKQEKLFKATPSWKKLDSHITSSKAEGLYIKDATIEEQMKSDEQKIVDFIKNNGVEVKTNKETSNQNSNIVIDDNTLIQEIEGIVKNIKTDEVTIIDDNSVNPEVFNTLSNNLFSKGYKPRDSEGNTSTWKKERQEKEEEETPPKQSKANRETIKRVKEFLERIGVKIEELPEVFGKNGELLEAKADFLKSLIEVTEGKESEALTEDAMHFAVELIEITNPKLFYQMFSQIHKYKIYSFVYDEYSKLYEKDGVPDIIKIKKEAIAKLLAEEFIKNSEGITENPELAVKAKSWWELILDTIKSLLKKAAFNPFEEAVKYLDSESIGNASMITSEDFYYKTATLTQDEVIQALLSNVKNHGLKKTINPLALEEDDRNFYSKEEEGKTVKIPNTYRVTSLVKHKHSRNFAERTAAQKESDLIKASNGTLGHEDMEMIIKAVTNPDFTLKPIDTLIDVKANLPFADKMIDYLVGTPENPGILYRFPAGSKFIIEQVLYQPYKNKKEKEKIGTSDLIVVFPSTEIKILDWKFMSFSLLYNTDIPKYKKEEYGDQLKEYKQMIHNTTGVPLSKISGEFIPIHSTYKKIDGKLTLSDISFGEKDRKKETRDYLLPFAISENPLLSGLIRAFEKSLEDLRKFSTDKEVKKELISAIERSLRYLRTADNFSPIVQQMSLFLNQIKVIEDERDSILALNYSNIDSASYDEDVKKLNTYLSSLFSTKNSIKSYLLIEDLFTKIYDIKNLSVEEKTLFLKIQEYSKLIEGHFASIESIQKDVLSDVALKTTNTKDILEPEVAITSLLMQQGVNPGRQDTQAMKFFTTLVKYEQNKTDLLTSSHIDQFIKYYNPFLQHALENGLNSITALSLIADKDTNRLFSKISEKFYEGFEEAVATRNIKWFEDNIDLEAYKKEVEKQINSYKEYLKTKEYHVDESLDPVQKQLAIEKLREEDLLYKINSYDISEDSSLGWGNKMMMNFKKEKKWYTEEYKKIEKNKALLDFYNYIRSFNDYAKQTGYLNNYNKLSFLPFFLPDTVDRIKSLKDIPALLKESVYTQVHEKRAYDEDSFIDIDTGDYLYSIPTFFTQPFLDAEGNNDLSKISTDIGHYFPIFIEAVLNHHMKTKIEPIYKVLAQEEKAKQHKKTDQQTGLILKNVNNEDQLFPDNTENTTILENYARGQLYGVENTLDIGNIPVKERIEEVVGENTEVSIMKTLDVTSKLVLYKALGFKPIIAITNYIGGLTQAVINAGDYYDSSEFFKAHKDILSSKFTRHEEDKLLAILDLLMPLHLDIAATSKGKNITKNTLRRHSFHDLMYSLMSLPDKALQYSNAVAFIENTIIVNGEMVNIRDHIKSSKEYKDRYVNGNVKEFEGKALKEKIEALKEKSILKTVSLNSEGKAVILGVDINSNSVAKYRSLIKATSNKITTNTAKEDKEEYNKNIFFRGFLTMRRWIIPGINVRVGGLQYDTQTEKYDYGRMRTFIKIMSKKTFDIKQHYLNITNILNATPEGIKLMEKIYQEKREEYFKKTGKELNLTAEQFYDILRDNIRKQLKETGALSFFSFLFFLTYSIAKAHDDDDKNKYKILARLLDKISDEVLFYYTPDNFADIAKGSFLPQATLLRDVYLLGGKTVKELLGNEETKKENDLMKAYLNMFPILNQLVELIIPIFSPELAKEMGIVVQAKVQRR